MKVILLILALFVVPSFAQKADPLRDLANLQLSEDELKIENAPSGKRLEYAKPQIGDVELILATQSKTPTLYFHRRIEEENGQKVGAWIRVVQPPAESFLTELPLKGRIRYSFVMRFYAFNCEKNTIGLVHSVYNDVDGRTLYTMDQSTAQKAVAPKSVGEGLLKYYCSWTIDGTTKN